MATDQPAPRLPGDVSLREVCETDLPVFFEYQRDPDANRMAAFPPRGREAFDAHWARILRDPTLTLRTVLFDGRVAGNVGCWEKDGRRLVGYWIGKDYWGKGVATRALAACLDLVATRPLYAHVAKSNVASIRVLEKCGFTVCRDEPPAAPDDGVEELVFVLAAS